MVFPMNDDSERLRERLVAMTRDLMLIPGTEERPDDLRRALGWVRNHLDGIAGLEIEEFESGGVPSLVARPVGMPEPAVLMCGHVDVVHHADPAAYRSELRGGRIVGPGGGDMKANVVIMLELMREFHHRRPGIPLAVAVTCDEERGGEHGTRALFEDHGLRCGLAMVPDGGSIDRVVVEEKGILHLELRAEGRACHAARPWLGVNAVELLARAVAAVRAEFAGDRPDHWHATCAVTRFGTRNRSFNRVPATAEATLDLRFPAPLTVAGMLERVRSRLPAGVAAEPAIGAEATVLAPDPMYLECCEAALGRPPELLREHGGSDARFIAAHGIPVIMSRPVSGNYHAVDEWIEISSMLDFHRIQRDYLERKLGVVGG